MRAGAGTWWTILRICLEERLVYRGDFALGTLMRFLPIVTQIFLWGAVFQSASPAGKSTIAGYTYEDMIAYYLLTMIARAFSSMPGLAGGIARQIRKGEIKKFLIQPVDMIGFLLAQPGGPQAGLLYGGRRAICAGFLSLPRAIFPAGPSRRSCWPFSLRW